MKAFIRVAKALSEQNRVKILKMLQRRAMCVCEIRAALGIAQPTVSKHLKILEESGLVTYKKDGTWVNYSLGDGADNPYVSAILGNLRHWLENEPEIKALLEKLPGIHRENILN